MNWPGQPVQAPAAPVADQLSTWSGFDMMPPQAPAAAPAAPPQQWPGQPLAQPQQRTGMDVAFDSANAALSGIPLLGGLTDEYTSAARAALHPLTGQGQPGASFSDRYGANLQDVRGRMQRFERENPLVAGGLQVAGGVAGTAPVAMTSMGARALGAAGETLLGRMGAGGLSGGVIGAADGATRANRPQDIAPNAMWGGLFGGVLGAGAPAAGVGAGRVMDAVADRMTGVGSLPGLSPGSSGILAGAARSDGLDTVTARLRAAEMGPEGMLLDYGPSMQGLGQGAVIRPGDGRSILTTALTERQRGQAGRIGADMEVLGPGTPPAALERGLREQRATVGRSYPGALQGADPVVTTGVLSTIDDTLTRRPGLATSELNSIRDLLAPRGRDGNRTPRADAEQIHSIRQAIDDMIGSQETGSRARTVLSDVRRSLDEALSGAAPGIKAVDAQYAGLARQSEALERGGQVLTRDRGAIPPAELQREMAEMSAPRSRAPFGPRLPDEPAPPVLAGPNAEAFRLQQGARAEIERVLHTNPNDLRAMQNTVAPNGDWNRDKLAILFGDQRAGQIFGAVDREAAFRTAYDRIVGGSQTAQRTAGAQAFTPELAQTPNVAGATAFGTFVAQPAQRVMNAMRNNARAFRSDQEAGEVAQALTRQGGDRDTLVDALMRRIEQQDANRRSVSQPIDAGTMLLINALRPVADRNLRPQR